MGIIEIKEKNYKKINFLLKAKSLSKENNFKLLFTLVNSFLAINEFDEARAELDKALIKNPKSELLIFNYAKVEEDLLNFKKAINLYEKGLKIDPNSYKALSNLGRLYQKNHNYPSAIKVFKKAIYLRPDLSHLKLSLLSCKAFSCDWSEPKYDNDLLNKINDLDREVCPYALFPFQDNPKKDLIRARNFFETKYKKVSEKICFKPKNKIRIGYFSADFRKHAVMYLIKGLFKLHNKEKFEIYVYSLSSQEDELTIELKKNVEVFRNFSAISDEQAAFIAREDSLDIAIDLMGYTKNMSFLSFL